MLETNLAGTDDVITFITRNFKKVEWSRVSKCCFYELKKRGNHWGATHSVKSFRIRSFSDPYSTRVWENGVTLFLKKECDMTNADDEIISKACDLEETVYCLVNNGFFREDSTTGGFN